MSSDELDFNDEKELQAWLKREFRQNGWDVYDEQRPKGTDYRADIIAHHSEYGWIGVECKYLKSVRCGSKFGRAIEQIIFQYRGKSYPKGAGQIDAWAVCPYFCFDQDPRHGAAYQTVREILTHFGIGILLPTDPKQRIDFAYSDEDTKISINQEAYGHYGDFDRITEMIQKKMRSETQGLGPCHYDTDGYGCSAPAAGTVSVGNYEIRLCETHLRRFEEECWQQEKSLSEQAVQQQSNSLSRI
jgi:hypothetical protein